MNKPLTVDLSKQLDIIAREVIAEESVFNFSWNRVRRKIFATLLADELANQLFKKEKNNG